MEPKTKPILKQIPPAKEMLVINANKIAEITGYKSAEVAIIKNVIAKNITDTELAFFLQFCRSVELNPFLKEIWCYQDGAKNLIVFAGRDGFLKKAQQNERWSGMSSAYVCEKDDFEIDMPAGIVKHKFSQKERGKVTGAYAILKPKGCEMATVAWAAVSEYDKGQAVWKTNKGAMIQKVAETQALKKAFGISGLQSEYDFEIKNNIVIPISKEEIRTDEISDETKKELASAFDKFKDDAIVVFQNMEIDIATLRELCASKEEANEISNEWIKEVFKSLERKEK